MSFVLQNEILYTVVNFFLQKESIEDVYLIKRNNFSMRDNIFLVYWIKIKQTLMDIPEISQIGKNLPVLYEVEDEPEKFVHSIDFL